MSNQNDGILDNSKDYKVCEWVCAYTEKGSIDIVTGYFTIGALAYLSEQINTKIDKFRIVVGDISKATNPEDRPINLLNETLDVESSLKLVNTAKEAVAFLKQSKVELKTSEPNFCHAKLYLFSASQDKRHHYFITGSSNITEAGIGLKPTGNVELNICGTGDTNPHYRPLAAWFESLWKNDKTSKNKTLSDKTKQDFKEYLIAEISKIFKQYTPKELYEKTVFELLHADIEPSLSDSNLAQQLGKLEEKTIYKSLYNFQKGAVKSLINMMNKHNGAILADAVGLGKTWTALAIIKYYEIQGRDTILLVPKKLESNWKVYTEQGSKFDNDKFRYAIKFHTDLLDGRINKDSWFDNYLLNDKPKLIVMDESHNLRNDKSARYQFLLNEVIKKNKDIKILLLSATPVNNSLNDIKNQIKLITKGESDGAALNLDIRNIDSLFRDSQTKFTAWRENKEPGNNLKNFKNVLNDSFFTLTNSLIIARTRKMIKEQGENITFPDKNDPDNRYITPKNIGHYKSFAELFADIPKQFSAYRPSEYIEEKTFKSILEDNKLREKYLVKMLCILLIKRFESSWDSLLITLNKILTKHKSVLASIDQFIANKNPSASITDDSEILLEDENIDPTIGVKNPINIKDIESAGKINEYKDHLNEDIGYLNKLITNLNVFKAIIDGEKEKSSSDTKLDALMKIIDGKSTQQNKKMIIFTAYADTAKYLYSELKKRGHTKIAFASGSENYDDSGSKKIKEILERFAPYSKLYKEVPWFGFEKTDDAGNYTDWLNHIKETYPATYNLINDPIDILIATDVLSEGQNLQDADLVINYDIHWNPVRVIQRLGRIDRIGSPNSKISSINFWPAESVDDYLGLQSRIEERMVAMRLVGAEDIKNMTERYSRISIDDEFDKTMKDNMMRKMQEEILSDVDSNENSLGLDKFSLEVFRQDIALKIRNEISEILDIPNGVFTGFITDENIATDFQLIALLGYGKRHGANNLSHYDEYQLIFIDDKGCNVMDNNYDILAYLKQNSNKTRYIPKTIDILDATTINKLAAILQTTLKTKYTKKIKDDDGLEKEVASGSAINIVNQVQRGSKQAIKKAKSGVNYSDIYSIDQQDLIVWFYVSKQKERGL